MTPQRDSRTLSDTDRLEVVGELAALINTKFDLNEIFEAAILKLRRVMEFRRASVLLLSEDRHHYYLHTLYDADSGGFVQLLQEFSLDEGRPGKVIRTGQAMLVNEFEGTEGIRSKGEQQVSALIVPLRVEDDVIGTLNFGVGSTKIYREEDLELAILLARPIETSLHYSRLFATIQSQREQLAIENAQVQSERTRLEALIEASDAAILMVSDDIVAHANGTMARLLGVPLETLVGAPMEHINQAVAQSLADPEALAVQTAALNRASPPLRDRVEFVFPRRAICQRTVATVPGVGGDVLGFLLLYRDVTREADAEAAKDEFLATVSHELRTPLTSIKTSLGLLGKGAAGTVTQQMQKFLDIALRNLQRLIRLVDDLLDLSRVANGRSKPTLVPVSIKEATDRAVEAVRGSIQERDVKLERDRPAKSMLVKGDADGLVQVVVNLLSNAVKFSPRGGRVTLGWRKDGDFAVLEISDEGPGLPADMLETIFDKFLQLDGSSTRRHEGVGLGLHISQIIVEDFGGRIWAESEDGQGSRFFVRLALADAAPKPNEIEGQIKTVQAEEGHRGEES